MPVYGILLRLLLGRQLHQSLQRASGSLSKELQQANLELGGAAEAPPTFQFPATTGGKHQRRCDTEQSTKPRVWTTGDWQLLTNE